MFIIITMMFREGQAPRPTKSDGDSVYAKQTERFLKCKGGGAGQRNSAVLERLWGWRIFVYGEFVGERLAPPVESMFVIF